MKRGIITSVFLMVIFLRPGTLFCDSMEDMVDQFGKEYEAMRPSSPNSSVNTDYRTGQTALGVFYTIKTLRLMYSQNKEMMGKYDEMLIKYNEIIKQNKEIIQLLNLMVKKAEEEKQREYDDKEDEMFIR